MLKYIKFKNIKIFKILFFVYFNMYTKNFLNKIIEKKLEFK